MYRTIIILITVLCTISVFSQPKTNLDSLTYDLYLKKKWDKVIDKINDALDRKIDNYFMRMRIGIAYFENGDYMSAAEHFNKAIKMQRGDDISKEYLYYSYLYAGKRSDASLIFNSISLKGKKKIKIKPSGFLRSVYLESGYQMNYDRDKISSIDINGIYNYYGEQLIPERFFYAAIGLTHNIGRRFTLFHSYIHYDYKNLKQFSTPDNGLQNFNLKTKQDDYYVSLILNAGKGYDVGLGFHYIHLNIKDIYYNSGNKSFDKTNIIANNYIASFYLAKSTGNFKFEYNSSYSNLNNSEQLINGLNLIYFPFGNLNLYLSSSFKILSDNESGKYKSKILLEPKLGLKLLDHIWSEFYYTAGEIKNYSEDNAYVVYNNPEIIRQMLGINILLPVIYEKLELSLMYQYSLQEHKYITYINSTDYLINTTKFKNHKFTGGLKWIF